MNTYTILKFYTQLFYINIKCGFTLNPFPQPNKNLYQFWFVLSFFASVNRRSWFKSRSTQLSFVQTENIDSWKKMNVLVYFLTLQEVISSILDLAACPAFGRTRRKISFTAGQDLRSFSTKTFPIKPVAPVTKMDLSAKNSAMEGIVLLFAICKNWNKKKFKHKIQLRPGVGFTKS